MSKPPVSSSPEVAAFAPLAGVRVVDFSTNMAGPHATMILAQLGADVIKVERPGSGDVTRSQLRDQPDADALYFTMLNSNKRSLTLDTKKPEGKAVLEKLIRESDVMVENFGPGALDRMGFTWEYIQSLNPGMILASVKDGKAAAVMCSYNYVNGQSACENRMLLTDVLRRDSSISAAYAYPGTPSTEIFQTIQDQARALGLPVRGLWSTNEKVALEEGVGVSYAGKRAIVSMKHVGLNVAADPQRCIDVALDFEGLARSESDAAAAPFRARSRASPVAISAGSVNAAVMPPPRPCPPPAP